MSVSEQQSELFVYVVTPPEPLCLAVRGTPAEVSATSSVSLCHTEAAGLIF